MSEREISNLKIQRGVVKGKLTRFKGFVDKCMIEPDIAELAVRLDKGVALYNEFEELQIKLELLEDADAENEREVFEEVYYTTVAQAKHLLSHGSTGETSLSNQNLEDAEVRIKLPTIELATFNGDYEKWLSFKDSFISVVDSNLKLSNLQKLQYLRSSLRGAALEIIQSLKTASENYSIAWELLLDRYENRKLIINSHMRELMEIPHIQKETHIAVRGFIDKVKSHLNSLEALNEPVKQWDTILLYTLTKKISSDRRKEWERETKRKDTPTIEEFLSFLEDYSQTLQIVIEKERKDDRVKQLRQEHLPKLAHATTEARCDFCSDKHYIHQCEKFKQLSLGQRVEHVKKTGLCFNCLRKGHLVNNCRSTKCRKCTRRHHTMLHQEEQLKATETSVVTHTTKGTTDHVLLSTARVFVLDSKGSFHESRVLLDSGSQSNFVTQEFAHKLELPQQEINITINGVNNAVTSIDKEIEVTIRSMHNSYSFSMKCLVVPQITSNVPQVELPRIKVPKHIQLADRNYNIPGKIDMLIGSDKFWKLISVGQMRISNKHPIIQKTLLGWILAGNVTVTQQNYLVVCNLSTVTTLKDQVEKFWNIEECKEQRHLSEEELYCEKHFNDTYTRASDGRFIVHLPKRDGMQLGDSKEAALQRFYALETRLSRNPQIQEEYTTFLNEYEELQHMKKITIKEDEENTTTTYYLPHHPVTKQDSLTTKLRVVFDGSAKTSSGLSLNDTLLVGPVIQEELFNIILRFRTHQFVLTADIAMMYRQIRITEEDARLQRICWRKDIDTPVSFYELQTVTYGTSSAPYLATKCLQQLAIDDGDDFPLAKKVLLQDFYVDDVLTGAETKDELIELHNQLTELLGQGKFNLRKWRTNEPEVLKQLQLENDKDQLFVLNKHEAVKTLGLLWNSHTDQLEYQIKMEAGGPVTKRKILSKIAQIFDPLGVLGPVIVVAKMIMQKLWQEKLSWDESVTQEVFTMWRDFCSNLESINHIHIPRNVNPNNQTGKITLHGFSDSSEKAYGACVYAVSTDADGKSCSYLLCSKSRIAPLKTISLPRLELCGALLLARLTEIVHKALKDKIQETHAWTDSTIVLAWIRKSPSELKTFVANRISEIQAVNQRCSVQWHHVPSKDNPGDCLSRGMKNVHELKTNHLWWFGPQWLIDQENWPNQLTEPTNVDLELKKPTLQVFVAVKAELFKRFSSFKKLTRVVAYCMRFANNCHKFNKRMTGAVTVDELKKAELAIIRMVQRETFPEEIKQLEATGRVHRLSKIQSLNPFLDEDQLIRVGGRLKNANLDTEHKHPYVLPSKHEITHSILKEEHEKLFHCGHEQLLSSIRQLYWPISGRSAAKNIVRNCIRCFRYQPRQSKHIMGDLPKSRVCEPSRPFAACGLDYAGPIEVKESRRRGRTVKTKAYVAVFVCMASKAVHLELVSSLSTEAFLAALRRFISRRGTCEEIYSDNATNFSGANKELQDIYKYLELNYEDITSALAQRKIKWHFIPPRSPHFGGIWEAAVRSMKRALYKVTNNQTFTFEECSTLLVEIEACLNSRPLTQLSTDPNDLSTLTPSHFLVGDSLLYPPERNYIGTPSNRLTRWQHLQQIRQHFWVRWRRDYLHQLQARSKWTSHHKGIEVGALAILEEDNTPPLKWHLAKVIAVHPGSDGVVRVVTVKTSSGVYKRSVKRVYLLPEREE